MKNFHPKAFAFEESSKNLKNKKSLTSSKLEICCEDHSIHLPTKVEKISCSSKDYKRIESKDLSYVKELKRRIVLTHYINTNLYLWSTFNILIFKLENFVFTTMSRDKQNLSLPDHLFKTGKINTRQDRSHGQGIFIIHTKNVTIPFFFFSFFFFEEPIPCFYHA